jgi:hypothetical protein
LRQYGKAKGDAVVDGGNPFSEVARSINPDRSVSDGPAGSMADGHNEATVS